MRASSSAYGSGSMLWCENTFTCQLLSLLEVSVKVGILPDPRTLCGPEAGASNPWCWRQQSCCPVGCWHPALWGHLTWCPPCQARAGEERRQDVEAEPQSCSCGWSAPGRLGPSPKAALYFLERAGHHARAETPSPRAERCSSPGRSSLPSPPLCPVLPPVCALGPEPEPGASWSQKSHE